MSGPRAEAGETLIEVIIATMLLGIAVVAIVGALGATVMGSHVHRSQADANTVLTTAAERIKSSSFGFTNVDCSVTDAVRITNYENQARGAINPTTPIAMSVPSGWTTAAITVSSVLFETVDTSSGTPTVTFGSSCDAAYSRQLVTLTVTSPDGRVIPTLSFVKGDI